MARGIYSAASGAATLGRALEVVSNNLANANSTGFKGEKVSFRQVMAGSGPDVSNVAVDQVRTDFSQGVTQSSGNPLDLALIGRGFFSVSTPAGERFTRDGSFTTTPEGMLATHAGQLVMGQSGPIRLDTAESVEIGEDGTVLNAGEVVDRLRVVDFQKPEQLVREGNGLWKAPRQAQPQAVETQVQPHALERSNVNPIQSMTELVLITRTYEQFHRAIEIFRELDQKIARDLG